MVQTAVLCTVAFLATGIFFILYLVARKRLQQKGPEGMMPDLLQETDEKDPKRESKQSAIMRAAVMAGFVLAGSPLFRGRESAAVKNTLRSLYPAKDPALVCRAYYAQKLGKLFLLLLAGLHLSWMLSVTARQDSILQNGRELLRGGYEKDADAVDLVITDENGESRVFSHALLGRTYNPQVLIKMADAMGEDLETLVLSDNPALTAVSSPLALKSVYADYPFSVDWESSDYTLLDSDGTVYNTELAAGKEVTLTAHLSYRSFSADYSFDVTVLPAQLSAAERENREVEQVLEREDARQQEDAVFLLPEKLNGKPVSYAIAGEGNSWLAGVFAAGLVCILYFLQDRDLAKKLTEKRQCVEAVYPRFVGKFVLLYGAGMSIRRILERLADDPGLEELSLQLQILLRDLHNGILEQTAIEQFGHRLGSPLYIKFSGLLIGNLKKGNTELLRMLKEEADAAFVLRRNQARKRGEEAGTKLLFPMILMLGVVMAVIMLPAFLSF